MVQRACAFGTRRHAARPAFSGALVALPTMIAMIRYQDSAWERAAAEPLRPGED
jgi:hypothetical protein